MIRVNDRVQIPQDDHPDINFVGLLIGPRGNTLKTLEKEVVGNVDNIMVFTMGFCLIFFVFRLVRRLLFEGRDL